MKILIKTSGTWRNQIPCPLRKNIHTLLLNLFLASGLMYLFTACEGETIVIDDISDETDRIYEVAAPLGKVHVTIDDLLKEFDTDSVIQEKEDGTLYSAYQQDYCYEWNDMLKLNDVLYNWEYPVLSDAKLSALKASAAHVEYTEQVVLNNEDGVRLDSMIIYQAMLQLSVVVPDGLEAGITISIPEVTKDGTALSYTFQTGMAQNRFYINEPLNGYSIDFSHSAEHPYGFISVVSQLITTNLSAGSADPVTVTFTLSDIVPDITFGQFGQKAVDEKNMDVSFDIFDQFDLDATIDFADYWVSITADNSIGAPFDVQLEDIHLINTTTNESKQLLMDEPQFSIDAAAYGDPIVTATGGLEISRANSNIVDLGITTYQPNQINGRIVASLTASDDEQLYFLSRTSKMKSTISLGIPLWFKTSLYSRIDTIDFDYNSEVGDDDKVTENLQEASMYFTCDNGLPFDMEIQAYAMDEQYQKVDSLFKGEEGAKLIPAAKINQQGLVVESTKTDFTAQLQQKQLQQFKERGVKYIFIQSGAVTASQGADFVKVSRTNFMDVSVALEASGRVN
ncbi:MAG: hypothetical protein JEZ14_06510 [Marinilabiliaceae bacterium]|nr:hypothetical protein [Marinilabiliaceae bacterium]